MSKTSPQQGHVIPLRIVPPALLAEGRGGRGGEGGGEVRLVKNPRRGHN